MSHTFSETLTVLVYGEGSLLKLKVNTETDSDGETWEKETKLVRVTAATVPKCFSA